jgi:signal transduction histidine kinase
MPIAASQALMGIQRITRVVGAMLEFSKAGGEDKAPADLNRAVESALTVCENRWRPVAELRVELGPLPWVPCRIGAIKQVILTVVDNAVQSMTDRATPGVLTVQTHAEDGYAVLEIGDTGHGIPEAIRDRVFDPFYTTREVGQGTGQGFATARAIVVEQHGGMIRFKSEVGVGTTFEVRLPT